MLDNTNGTANSEEDVSFSCYDDWGIGIATISAVMFVTNIFHLIIISRMRQLRGRPYRLILIHITLADIGSSVLLLMFYSCLPGCQVISRSVRGIVFIWGIAEWPAHTSHWIFLVAGLEQYYSICKPLLCKASKFIQKLSLVLVSTWIVSFSWSAIGFASPTILRSFNASSMIVFQLVDVTIRYVPLILAAVPLTLVVRELRKMRHPDIADHQKQNRRAAVFLIIIYCIFLAFSLFDMVMGCAALFNPHLMSLITLRLKNVTKCLYGILNTVIYGFRTKAYRQEIRRLVCRQD